VENITYLLLAPIVVAILQLVVRQPMAKRIIALLGSATLIGISVVMFIRQYNQPDHYYLVSADDYNHLMLVMEGLLALYLAWVGIRRRKWFISLFAEGASPVLSPGLSWGAAIVALTFVTLVVTLWHLGEFHLGAGSTTARPSASAVR